MKSTEKNSNNLVIVGASKGLGHCFATNLAPLFTKTLTTSRNEPEYESSNTRWVRSDLTQPAEAAEKVAAAHSDPIDLLIYNAASWHDKPFIESSIAENEEMITVNLTSAIAFIQTLWPQLTARKGSLIVLIGSTSGLDNSGGKSVTYAASKFGLRGLAHAVREEGRPYMLRTSVISPGGLTAEPNSEIRIPYNDMSNLIQCIYSMSPATCPKEIILPATFDTGV